MKVAINNIVWGVLISALATPAYALKPADEAIIELYQRVEDLQHDVNSLRGVNEQLRHELDSVKKSQKESFIDIDDRIQAVDKKIVNSSDNTNNDTATTESAESPEDPIITDSSTAKSTENDNTPTRKVDDSVAYKRAYDLLKDDPTAAAADFKDFLEDYPSSPLAANAHYWIGETLYSKEDFEGAKQRFLTILKDYKGSNKEPDAALKLGYTFIAMKQWEFAKKTLNDVIKFFPGTRESELAEKKLASIKDK